MAAKFVALALACKKAEWLMNLLYEIPLWPKPTSPLSLQCESASILVKSYSNVYNGKSRHIGLHYSYVK